VFTVASNCGILIYELRWNSSKLAPNVWPCGRDSKLI